MRPLALLSFVVLAGACYGDGAPDVVPRSEPVPDVPIDSVVPPVEADRGATAPDSSLVADGAEAPPGPPPPVVVPAEPLRFERPEHVRGLYLNAWTAGSSRRIEQLVEVARATEINAFVIDIKDASGFVSHSTAVEEARAVGATGEIRIRDLPGLLARLHDEGIYPIARIVIVKDPVLIAARPELAVQDTAGGPWIDSKDFVWLNPYDRRVWDYHVDLAREVARLGFPEIQWDYVRFPDAPASDMARAVFPGDSLGSRVDAVEAFLDYAREELRELDVRSTADVFGVTTSFQRDVGIGQLWESFIDRVDAALPMVYPSHYWKGSFGYERPNAHPYEIVRRALEDGLARSEAVAGAGALIPWLQDFTLGEPSYGGPEVRAQIQATHDVGIEDWILWNPGSRYTVEALEPVGGFPSEPHIRVGGKVVPVSERHEARAVPPPDTTAADTTAADTTSADTPVDRRRERR